MKNILKYLRFTIIYLVIFQCCAGFTVYKLIRIQHIHHYIHAKDCQVKSALGLDCFNHCNGVQNNCEESQKKDKNSGDQNFHTVFNAIIVSSHKICLAKHIDVPPAISMDVNLLKGSAKSIFQPPKAV